MTDAPKTITDIAEFMVEWNDRAAKWLRLMAVYIADKEAGR
jgi:hypothetical protein